MCLQQHLVQPHNSVRPLLLLFLFDKWANRILEEVECRIYSSSPSKVLSAGPVFPSPSSHLELPGHRELWRGQAQEGIKATAQQDGQD